MQLRTSPIQGLGWYFQVGSQPVSFLAMEPTIYKGWWRAESLWGKLE